jgi:hypothetical protein
VVTQADATAKRQDVNQVVANFQRLVPATVTIPFDRAMVDGVLNFDRLATPTQRAWLAAAAAIARNLSNNPLPAES